MQTKAAADVLRPVGGQEGQQWLVGAGGEPTPQP